MRICKSLWSVVRGPVVLVARGSSALYSAMPNCSAGRRLLTTICIVLAVAVGIGSRPVAQSNAANPLAREIFKELIEIPTTAADGTAKAAQAIVKRLIAAGFAAEDAQILGPDPRTPLVVARYRGTDPAAKPVLFMAHMDVVPARREDWSVDPWVLLEREGWFYGRGTSDNKTGVTSIVANLVRLKGEGVAAATGSDRSCSPGTRKRRRPGSNGCWRNGARSLTRSWRSIRTRVA